MGNKPSAPEPPPPVNTSLNDDECADYTNKMDINTYVKGTREWNCHDHCCVKDSCKLGCKNFYNTNIKENFQNIIEGLTEGTKAQSTGAQNRAKIFNNAKDAVRRVNYAATKAGKAAKGASANETQSGVAREQAKKSAKDTKEIMGVGVENANQASKQANTHLQGAKIATSGIGDIVDDAEDSANNAGIFADNAEKAATDVTGHIADISGSVGAAYKFMTDAEKAALSAAESELFAADKAKKTKEQLDEAATNITGSAALSNSASGNIINQQENKDIEKSVGKLLDSIEGTDGFTNLKEGFPSESLDLLATILSKITNFADRNIQATNKAVDIRSKMTHTELLAQDNNIVNNMLMDYLINEEEGTNVEKVYNKLSQDSTKKMRTIQMNNYKTKVYKEYIYLLKIIILSIILLIPVLLITKLELISKNMSLAIVVALIFVVILYIGYRLYILRMRDNINFDKVRMNFDRENAEMLKTKGTSMYEKKGPLGRLGVTCIGDECCDENMVYDNLRHKCVLQENFGNFFEKLNDNLASDINIVKPNNLNENTADFTFVNNGTNNVKEAFVSRNNIQLTKEGLFMSSLNNSSQKQFQKNVVPSLLFE
jgi:hypothetical protein